MHYKFWECDVALDEWVDKKTKEVTEISITASRADVKVDDTVEIEGKTYTVLEIDYYPETHDCFTASLSLQKQKASA
jgi:hypothetical protein